MSPAARNGFALFAFLVLVALVALVGGAATAKSVTSWYPTLAKPSFTPPNWVFGPAWTTLYTVMAIAAWRVWRSGDGAPQRSALTLFYMQLALNLSWSLVFFGARQVHLGLLVIVLMLALIVFTTLRFFQVDRPAGLLMLPYIAWVSFATALNTGISVLNP